MTDSKTHAVVGAVFFVVAFWLATSVLNLEIDLVIASIGFLLALFASQFPDIDMPNSNVSEWIYRILILGGLAGLGYWYFFEDPIGVLVGSSSLITLLAITFLKHRGVTHSYGFLLATTALFFLVEPVFGLFWFSGYLSHLLADGNKGKYL